MQCIAAVRVVATYASHQLSIILDKFVGILFFSTEFVGRWVRRVPATFPHFLTVRVLCGRIWMSTALADVISSVLPEYTRLSDLDIRVALFEQFAIQILDEYFWWRVDFSYGTLLKIYIHKLIGLSDVYVNNICYKYRARVNNSSVKLYSCYKHFNTVCRSFNHSTITEQR